MKVAVYCSAKDAIPEEYLQLGDALGAWLGENGHTLLYGGATGGLMSRVSDAAKANGATVVGVIPPRIIAAGRLASNCDYLIQVANMAERKQIIRSNVDAIVCLPGSYGTLDEMMDATSSAIVGEHHTPTYVLNYNGFYDLLKQQIEHMKALRFIPTPEHYCPTFVDTLDELFEKMRNDK